MMNVIISRLRNASGAETTPYPGPSQADVSAIRPNGRAFRRPIERGGRCATVLRTSSLQAELIQRRHICGQRAPPCTATFPIIDFPTAQRSGRIVDEGGHYVGSFLPWRTGPASRTSDQAADRWNSFLCRFSAGHRRYERSAVRHAVRGHRGADGAGSIAGSDDRRRWQPAADRNRNHAISARFTSRDRSDECRNRVDPSRLSAFCASGTRYGDCSASATFVCASPASAPAALAYVFAL